MLEIKILILFKYVYNGRSVTPEIIMLIVSGFILDKTITNWDGVLLVYMR